MVSGGNEWCIPHFSKPQLASDYILHANKYDLQYRNNACQINFIYHYNSQFDNIIEILCK